MAWSANSNSVSIRCAGLGGDSKTSRGVFSAKSTVPTERRSWRQWNGGRRGLRLPLWVRIIGKRCCLVEPVLAVVLGERLSVGLMASSRASSLPQVFRGWRKSERPETTKPSHFCEGFVLYGAGTRSRTRDLLITSQLLYQLSYTGVWATIIAIGCVL